MISAFLDVFIFWFAISFNIMQHWEFAENPLKSFVWLLFSSIISAKLYLSLNLFYIVSLSVDNLSNLYLFLSICIIGHASLIHNYSSNLPTIFLEFQPPEQKWKAKSAISGFILNSDSFLIVSKRIVALGKRSFWFLKIFGFCFWFGFWILKIFGFGDIWKNNFVDN